MTEFRLPLPAQAYRFDLLLEFLRRIACPARLIVHGDTLWRFTEGQLLSYHESADAIIVRGESLTADNVDRIERASRRWLGLERDLTAFYEFAKRDPDLWPVVEPLLGLPIFCSETVFEALVTLIIEQHITWKSALRSQRELLRLTGTCARAGQTAIYDFPTPARLARASQAELKPLKITNKRIDLIIAIADAADRGELDIEGIRRLPPKKAYEQLLAIKGVGHWTASNVIGRALGRYPYVSHNDVALQAAARHYFHDGAGQKSAAQVTETLSRYGKQAGMAGHFTLLRWVLDHYPALDHRGPPGLDSRPKARLRQAPSSS